MRVWVDAQLPPALARWLAEEFTIEANHVIDMGLVDADDAPIFNAARVASITAVITKDEDFVRLLEQHGPPPQVVWITVGNIRNRELRRVVLDAWPRVAELLVANEALVEIRRQD
jgi:predicted nuclease of predicted toxin-antitoxin system